MKTPLLIAVAIILGIVAVNTLVPKKADIASDTVIEDTIDTSLAAPKHVDGDVPL